MIRKENYHVCSHCYIDLQNRGMPFLELLESIIEVFSILKEPVAIRACNESKTILDYLEYKNYIITTEFPDSAYKDQDIILAIPTGCHQLHDLPFFCFDRSNHE
jgi:hypothetical protein